MKQTRHKTARRILWNTTGYSRTVCSVDDWWRFRRASLENWGAENLRPHHSNRTNPGVDTVFERGLQQFPITRRRIRSDLEKIDSQGKGIAGTAHGLPLMVPVRSLVVDIQKTFHGSGGYGKFILIEYLEGDLIDKESRSPPDTVEDFRPGKKYWRSRREHRARPGVLVLDMPPYDIVGTAECSLCSLQANQSGDPKQPKTAQEPTQTETQTFRYRYSYARCGSSWTRTHQTRNERRSGQTHSKTFALPQMEILAPSHKMQYTHFKRIRA